VEVNLCGTFHYGRAAVRRMRAQGRGGSIVTISSGRAPQLPLPVPYPASKAGVLGLTRTAAARLGPDNIRVNAVAPRRHRHADASAARQRRPAGGDRPGVDPAGCSCRGDGEHNLVLASDEAAFITGQTVSPNGGAYM